MSAMATRWIDRLQASLANNFAALGHPVKYVQLATCAATSTPHSPTSQPPSWAPRVRTVVFRGLVANGTAHLVDDWNKASLEPAARPAILHDELVHLLFVTDLRTHKVDELKVNPLVEVCWYFAHSREQFRFSGVGAVVEEAQPDPSKVKGDTAVPSAAGKVDWHRVRERMWAAQSPAAKRTYLDSSAESSDLTKVSRHFGLLYVTVNHVDHLDLRSTESQESTVWSLRHGEYHALKSTL